MVQSLAKCCMQGPCLEPYWFFFYFLFNFFFFIGPHLRHMKVPRLGAKFKLQLPAYITATATWDTGCLCNLCCSLWQHWILNQLSEARDQFHILMDTTRVLNPLSHNGTQ